MNLNRVIRLCVLVTFVVVLSTNIVPVDKTETPGIKYPSVFQLSSEDKSWVENTLSKLTLSEKCAQMIMPAVYKEDLDTSSVNFLKISSMIKEKKIGGVILYQGKLVDQINFIKKIKQLSDYPLLISSDFERGLGSRIENTIEFPHAMALGSTHKSSLAYEMGDAVALECTSLGVNWNFAPVVDINNNPNNPVINIRSFSENRIEVSDFAKAFVLGSKNHKVITTAKHFPGHGNTELDSHYDLPKIIGEKSYLLVNELEPFQELIDAGVHSIMIGHLEVPSLEIIPGIPASLSKSIVTYLLKDEMKFDGLIVTDAMIMEAVTKFYSDDEATVLAVIAGNDIILSPPDAEVSISALVDAVNSGEIKEERIDESVRKILSAKRWLNSGKEMFSDEKVDLNSFQRVEHKELAKRIAEESITLLKNENNLIPLRSQNYKNIYCVTLTDGNGGERAQIFQNNLEKRVPGITTKLFTKSSKRSEYNSFINELKSADLIIIPSFIDIKTYTGPVDLSAEQTDFIADVLNLKIPSVLISFKNPYLAYLFPDAQVILNSYSHSIVSQNAMLKGILGEIRIGGSSPVTIPSTKFAYGFGIKLEKSLNTVLNFNAEQINIPLIDTTILNVIDKRLFPGTVLCVGNNGNLILNNSYGTIDYVSHSEQISESEIFNLGNFSTSFTSILSLMILNEENLLNPDDKVHKYIKDFYSYDKKDITIHDLLSHTSGFGNVIPGLNQSLTKEELINIISFLPLENKSGTKENYSIINDIVLQVVIEKLTDKNTGEIFNERVVQKLNLGSSLFFDSPDSNPVFHLLNKKKNKNIPYVKTSKDVVDEILYGDSGYNILYSDSKALAVILQMLLQNGYYGDEQIISSESVNLYISYLNSSLLSKNIVWLDTDEQQFIVLLSSHIANNLTDLRYQQLLEDIKNIILDKQKIEEQL